ncbi:hypothetical protein H4R19_006412, partial [Coemansia spiralis]
MAAPPHRRRFNDDDDPPEYTALPLPSEASLDAGAGAPIVRVQPPHRIINPSDPRSQYTRHYLAQTAGGALPLPPPPPPRPGSAVSGPVLVRPPPRLGALLERIDPLRIGHSSADTAGALWGQPPRSSSSPHVVQYTAVCPLCRNSGWLLYKVACTCPAGRTKRSASPRGHSSSLLGFIDDMLAPPPPPRSRLQSGPAPHSSSAGPLETAPGRRSPPYLQYVPGPGAPCPNCLGQS